MTQFTKKGHIARATLEATCYQTKAILDAMERDSGKRLESLAVDGGLSNSDLTMQFQADVTGIPVDRPSMRETTALGAAIAAGLATGVWNKLDDLRHVNRTGRRVFKPCENRTYVNRMVRKWEQAVEMSRGWVRNEADCDEEAARENAQETARLEAEKKGADAPADAISAGKPQVQHVEKAAASTQTQ